MYFCDWKIFLHARLFNHRRFKVLKNQRIYLNHIYPNGHLIDTDEIFIRRDMPHSLNKVVC